MRLDTPPPPLDPPQPILFRMWLELPELPEILQLAHMGHFFLTHALDWPLEVGEVATSVFLPALGVGARRPYLAKAVAQRTPPPVAPYQPWLHAQHCLRPPTDFLVHVSRRAGDVPENAWVT